jgi:glycosyltransferase involved in cell wall biosynthesis
MKVVAVIPALNEETRIGDVIRSVKPYVDSIIVVDDGSRDQTPKVAKDSGADTVISHADNCGAGAATMTGISAARMLGATVVITLDADGQHDPADIPALLAPIREGKCDAVFANRFGRRNKIPLIRRLFNMIGNMVTFGATGKWVADSQCGFKAFGPTALEQLDLKMNGFEFCSEIVREAVQHRWRIEQVPTKVMYSEYTLAKGQSFAGGVKTALKLLLRSFIR